MTQSDKDLLLKDICSRLPYGVKVLYENKVFNVEYISPMYEEVKLDIPETWTINIDEVKPYLFPLSSITDEQFDEVINTNLRSCFKMCRAAIMPMMKNRFGRIINMASIIGAIGGPGQAHYAASKGGMIAMTKSIAAEVGSRGITANTVAPGFIKTPMTDVLPEDLKKTYLSQIPAGRFGEPEDIANACVFLASDEASYINGQTLHINGGMGRF